jgi:transcriptional regulator with XRE-family HTH domain
MAKKAGKASANAPARALRPIGRLLREARLKRDLSLRDVELLSGLAITHVSRTETGASKNPAFLTVARIAAVVGVSLDALSAQMGVGTGASAADDGSTPDATRAAKALDIARASAQAILDAVDTARPASKPKRRRRS